MGYSRERKFISKCKKSDEKKPETWNRLVEFLKVELGTRERLTLLYKSKKCLGIEQHGKNLKEGKGSRLANTIKSNNVKCHICDKEGHVLMSNCNGRQDVPYFACKKFVEMTTENRRKIIFEKKFCAQCLEPGVKFDEDHECSTEYVCTDKFHKRFKSGLHVLICSHHRERKENLDLLELFKRNVLSNVKNLDDFSKKISISYYSQSAKTTYVSENTYKSKNSNVEDDVFDTGIFMLQTIRIEGNTFNLFFDSGCGDMVIKKSAVNCLMKLGRAKLERPGPITLYGVGGQDVGL